MKDGFVSNDTKTWKPYRERLKPHWIQIKFCIRLCTKTPKALLCIPRKMGGPELLLYN